MTDGLVGSGQGVRVGTPVGGGAGEARGPLGITTEDVAAGVVCCAVSGEVDLATGPRLRHALTGLLDERPCHLVIDLSGVDFLGSIGLTILLEVNTRQQAAGRCLAFVVADNRMARRPLEATGLTKVLDVYSTLAAAVTACQTTTAPVDESA